MTFDKIVTYQPSRVTWCSIEYSWLVVAHYSIVSVKNLNLVTSADVSSDDDHEEDNDDNSEHAKQVEHPAAANINKPKGINRLSRKISTF